MLDEDWRFGGTWPYEPRWLEVDGVRIHYVDEGAPDGQPVVLAHGNPTWSYLYRRFVAGLGEAGFRAIAWDQMGFGRSQKPDRVDAYTIPRHVEHFSRLMETLEVDGVTLVMHDWGAVIGLAWAVRHPERVRRLVILNSFTGSHPPWSMPLQLRLLYMPVVGAVLTRGLRATVRLFLFRGGTLHPERLGRNERNAYLAPHPSWASRAGLRAAVRILPWNDESDTPPIGREIDGGLARLASKPALIAWGKGDAVVHRSWLEHYRSLLPDAEVHELDGAGHFVQEDAHERLVPLLVDFLRRT
jgi:pimeloyl-ACP methyl ester carboxylesterase